MSKRKIIPVTIEKYNELVHKGQIDETAFYKIVEGGYFRRMEWPPNILICEEKTFNLRWLRVGKEKILQQLVIKRYPDHYEEEWQVVVTKYSDHYEDELQDIKIK